MYTPHFRWESWLTESSSGLCTHIVLFNIVKVLVDPVLQTLLELQIHGPGLAIEVCFVVLWLVVVDFFAGGYQKFVKDCLVIICDFFRWDKGQRIDALNQNLKLLQFRKQSGEQAQLSQVLPMIPLEVDITAAN